MKSKDESPLHFHPEHDEGCGDRSAEDHSLLTVVQPEIYGFTLPELATAANLTISDILAIEASGRIRSLRLPNGDRFYSYGEVAFLVEGGAK